MVFKQMQHLVNMANDFKTKWPMFFNQMKHLIKMTNDL
jgi:hypothetical protein